MLHNEISNIENFFYSDFWPEYLFINQYPIIGVFWNIFLLTIPFFVCRALIGYWSRNKFKKTSNKIVAIFLGFIWLLFIPNTAYIITDVRHLLNYCSEYNFHRVCLDNAWMTVFFFSYALVGWIAFVLLLRQMNNFIKNISSKFFSSVFIIFIIPLIALGVLLGLLNRWNSWEFFSSPLSIFLDLFKYFTQIDYFINFSIFAVFLYLLYFIGNYLIKDIFDK